MPLAWAGRKPGCDPASARIASTICAATVMACLLPIEMPAHARALRPCSRSNDGRLQAGVDYRESGARHGAHFEREVRTMRQTDGARNEGIGRRALLGGMLALGGGVMLGGCSGAMQGGSGGAARMTGGKISVRWLGGGVVELATPDYKQIAFGDAWVWNNAGWQRFSVPKPRS